jgi:hypothetical protein
MVWNNIDPVPIINFPNWTNELFNNKDKIKWAWGKDEKGWYVIEAAIPRTEAVGLMPAEGKEMGVRLWVQGILPTADKDKPTRYFFEMFDTCEYGYFKLVK